MESFQRADGVRGKNEWKDSSTVRGLRKLQTPAGECHVMPIESNGWWYQTLANGARDSGRWSRASMARRRAAPAAAAAALAVLAVLAVLVLLGGCASRGPSKLPATSDGPEARPPSGLEQVPDAVPRVEPLRVGGPNKPYEVLGRRYMPMTSDQPLQESGLASWYGRKFHGQPTASGETYDMYAMSAAHKTMPIPSYARVRNPANGREVIVRINDRGPFAAGRVVDLSYTAALKLGVLSGVAPVQVQRLSFDDIRSGRWRVGTPADGREALPPDDPAPGDSAASGAAAAGFWLQLGAFRQRDAAQQLQQRLLSDAETGLAAVAVFDEAGWFRVQAGPYATRTQAQQAADRALRQTGRSALIVERGPSLNR